MDSSYTTNAKKTHLETFSLGILNFQSFNDNNDAFSFQTANNKEKMLDSIKNEMILETTIRNVILNVPMLLNTFRNKKFNFYTISFLVFTSLHLLTFFFFSKNINEITLTLLMSFSFLNNLIEMLFCSGYKITTGLKEIGFVYTVFNLLAETVKTLIVYSVFNNKVNYLTFLNVQDSLKRYFDNNLPHVVIYGKHYSSLSGFYVILFIENLFKMLRLKKTLNRYYDNKNEKNKFSLFWMCICKYLYFYFVRFIVKFLFKEITNGTLKKEMETHLPRTKDNQKMVDQIFECVYQLSSLEYFVSSSYNVLSYVILDVAFSKELVFGDINTKLEPNEELV